MGFHLISPVFNPGDSKDQPGGLCLEAIAEEKATDLLTILKKGK